MFQEGLNFHASGSPKRLGGRILFRRIFRRPSRPGCQIPRFSAKADEQRSGRHSALELARAVKSQKCENTVLEDSRFCTGIVPDRATVFGAHTTTYKDGTREFRVCLPAKFVAGAKPRPTRRNRGKQSHTKRHFRPRGNVAALQPFGGLPRGAESIRGWFKMGTAASWFVDRKCELIVGTRRDRKSVLANRPSIAGVGETTSCAQRRLVRILKSLNLKGLSLRRYQ